MVAACVVAAPLAPILSPPALAAAAVPGRLAVVVPVPFSLSIPVQTSGPATILILVAHRWAPVPGVTFPGVQPPVQGALLPAMPVFRFVTSSRFVLSFGDSRLNLPTFTALHVTSPLLLHEQPVRRPHSLGLPHLFQIKKLQTIKTEVHTLSS